MRRKPVLIWHENEEGLTWEHDQAANYSSDYNFVVLRGQCPAAFLTSNYFGLSHP